MGDEDYTRMEELANLLGWNVFYIDLDEPDSIPVFYKGVLFLEDLREVITNSWDDIKNILDENGDNRKIDQFIQDQYRVYSNGKQHKC